MKTKYRVIAAILLALVVISLSVILIINHNDKKLTEEVLGITINKTLSTDNIIIDNECSKDQIDKFNETWRSIPNKITDSFCDNEWKVVLTSTDLTEYYNTNYNAKTTLVEGLTIRSKKIIFVDKDSDINSILKHEMGHYVDTVKGNVSDGNEFFSIFNKEVEQFTEKFNPDKGHVASWVEYFAEAFYRYLDSTNELKEACPTTYEFFKTNMSY